MEDELEVAEVVVLVEVEDPLMVEDTLDVEDPLAVEDTLDVEDPLDVPAAGGAFPFRMYIVKKFPAPQYSDAFPLHGVEHDPFDAAGVLLPTIELPQ